MAREGVAASDRVAAARALARSVVCDRTGRDGSVHSARRRCGDRGWMISRHGLDSPGRAPAPPWSSVATWAASASAGPPSSSGPLRGGGGRGARPDAAAPTRAPGESPPTVDSRPCASRAAAPSRMAGSARAPRRRRHRAPPPHDTPRIDRTVRPEPRRSFREGWTSAATGDTVPIGRRVEPAPVAKARVFHHPGLHLLQSAIYVVTASDVADDVRRSVLRGTRQIDAERGGRRHPSVGGVANVRPRASWPTSLGRDKVGR